MQTGFNSIQESSLEMTLTGLRQEKYIQQFNKKGVTKFDTFVNMTEEDLLYVGIVDDDDREKILNGIGPLKQLYKDVNEFGPPDLNLIIGNNLHHIRTLFGSLIMLKRDLVRRKPKNILIDNTHSSVNALNTLLDILKEQLDYVEDDITVKEDLKTTSKRRNFLFIGLIASSCAIGAIVVARYLDYRPYEALTHLKFPTLKR